MNFDLNKACVIRRSQDDNSVSFRVCFADEQKNWVGHDFVVPKDQFVDVVKLDPSSCQPGPLDEKVFNLDRARKGFTR